MIGQSAQVLRRIAAPAVCAASLLLTACADQNLPVQSGVPGPRFDLQDGVHNGGNTHFFFLPPIAVQPIFSGVFDPSLEPVVRVCEWTGAVCLLPPVAEFTTATGPGTETVRVDLVDELYGVNWHTGRFALEEAKTYRISVLLSGAEVGHADVDVVSSGRELKSVNPDAFAPVLNGQTLPIKFRIEEGVAVAPPPSWIQLDPLGGPPAGREGHTAVYEPTANRMIVFGGFRNGVGPMNDLWVLADANGIGGSPSWIEIASAGTAPPTRSWHSAVYDGASNRMIVFGGYSGGNAPLNDVWVLTNASGVGGTPTWIELQPTGTPPAARFYHTAVYDPATNRMIVFDGGNLVSPSTEVFDDVWVLTNANGLGGTASWTQLTPSGTAPGARIRGTAVYDPGSNRMTIFGGFALGSVRVNDVWMLTNANGIAGTPTWTQLAPIGGTPEVREGHTAVYDVTTNRMTILGGLGYTVSNDAWVLTNANGLASGAPTWAQLAPTGSLPPARLGHTAVYDPASNRMIVFGGSDDHDDTWVLTNASGIP